MDAAIKRNLLKEEEVAAAVVVVGGVGAGYGYARREPLKRLLVQMLVAIETAI